MSADKKWKLELDEYIRQGEPDKKEKSEAWEVAIGPQAVDGLHTLEYLHLDYREDEIQTAKSETSNGKICLKELPIEEKAVLEVIIANPEITQKEIANKIGKSERTVRNKISSLKEKGILERVNGKRNGKWEVH